MLGRLDLVVESLAHALVSQFLPHRLVERILGVEQQREAAAELDELEQGQAQKQPGGALRQGVADRLRVGGFKPGVERRGEQCEHGDVDLRPGRLLLPLRRLRLGRTLHEHDGCKRHHGQRRHGEQRQRHGGGSALVDVPRLGNSQSRFVGKSPVHVVHRKLFLNVIVPELCKGKPRDDASYDDARAVLDVVRREASRDTESHAFTCITLDKMKGGEYATAAVE